MLKTLLFFTLTPDIQQIIIVHNLVEIVFLSLSNYYPKKFDMVNITCYICQYHVSDKESL